MLSFALLGVRSLFGLVGCVPVALLCVITLWFGLPFAVTCSGSWWFWIVKCLCISNLIRL